MKTNKAHKLRAQQQRELALKRMADIQAKLQLGVLQVMEAVKQLPLHKRVAVAVEILFALKNRNYNAYGEYIGAYKDIKGRNLGFERVNSMNEGLINDEDVTFGPCAIYKEEVANGE